MLYIHLHSGRHIMLYSVMVTIFHAVFYFLSLLVVAFFLIISIIRILFNSCSLTTHSPYPLRSYAEGVIYKCLFKQLLVCI